MMADTGKRVDFEKLFSLANDLTGMLHDGKDRDNLLQFSESAKSIRYFYETNVHETNVALGEYQKRINECMEKMEKGKRELIADNNLDNLQTELEEQLQLEHSLHEELRIVNDELDNLEQQRISFEERWKLVKKREKDVQKLHDSMSMFASVTEIIPTGLSDKRKISGFIVRRSKGNVEKFDCDPAMPPFEVCDWLWKTMPSQ